MSSHPHDARPMTAPGLTVELREAIDRWFAARDMIPISGAILAALADLAAEQIAANPIAANPTHEAQCVVMSQFTHDIIVCINAANRRRMGGVQVELVVK